MSAAIEIINHEPDKQPTYEPDPVHDRQACHQQKASEDGKDWSDGSAWGAECPWTIGFAVAEDEDTRGDQREGKKRPDVGQITQGANVE
jgi:hypothetical protein